MISNIDKDSSLAHALHNCFDAIRVHILSLCISANCLTRQEDLSNANVTASNSHSEFTNSSPQSTSLPKIVTLSKLCNNGNLPKIGSSLLNDIVLSDVALTRLACLNMHNAGSCALQKG